MEDKLNKYDLNCLEDILCKHEMIINKKIDLIENLKLIDFYMFELTETQNLIKKIRNLKKKGN